MKKGEPQLISASTILILSGFLIGLTVGKIVSDSLSPYVLSCGLAGFLAFIALEFTGTQREEQSAHEEQIHVQGRLNRHVLSQSSMTFRMPEDTDLVPPHANEINSLSQSTINLKRLDNLYEQLMKVEAKSDSTVLEPMDSSNQT